MSDRTEHTITFGGREYILESTDGGQSGSVFEPGADRWDVSYGYLRTTDGVKTVSRFRSTVATGDEIVVGEGRPFDYDSVGSPTAEQFINCFMDLTLTPEEIEAREAAKGSRS